MKKHVLGLACVAVLYLALPTGGLCQQEFVTACQMKEDAAAGWHQTYSAYGRTVDVSIDIDFPSIDAVPVIRLRGVSPDLTRAPEPEAWTLSQSRFFFELHTAESPWSEGWYKQSIELPAGQVDWQTPMTPENPYTPRQAYDILMRQLSQAFPEEILISLRPETVLARGHLYQYNRKTRAFGDMLDSGSLYELRFTQQFHSIPILYAGQHALFITSLSGEARPPSCGLDAMILSEDSLSFSGYLLEEERTVQDDVPLASLDRILGQYEALIDAGRLREVQSLRFGYMLCVDPEREELAYAIPVWSLYGVLYDTAEQEMPVMPEAEAMKDTRPFRPVIVYAQSGELLDVNRTDPQRRCTPDMLLWEEVHP